VPGYIYDLNLWNAGQLSSIDGGVLTKSKITVAFQQPVPMPIPAGR